MGRTADILIGAALLAFGVALLLWLIPNFVGAGDQATLPNFVATSISALAAGLIVGRLFRSEPRNADDSDPFVETGGGEPMIVLLLAIIWCGFLLLTNLLGFYLGGALALAVSFLALGVRTPLVASAWIGGTLIVVHLVFERLMSLSLPRGTIEGWLGL
jgi:hypothetical protein